MAIELNDLLTQMRMYLNNSCDGLEASYEECKEEEKSIFIESCQHLVTHGWQENSLGEMSHHDFFSVAAKSALFEPSKNLFKNRRDLDSNSDALIILCGRCCLMRILFDMFQSKKIKVTAENSAVLKNWFLESRQGLDVKLRGFNIAEYKIIYEGKEITSLETIRQFRDHKRERAAQYERVQPAVSLAFLSCVVLMVTESLDLTSRNTSFCAINMLLLLILYASRSVRDQVDYRFFGKYLAEANTRGLVQMSPDMRRYLFISDAELDAVFPVNDLAPESARLRVM